MKLKPVTVIAAIIVIGAGGFMAGRVSSPGAQEAAPDGPVATKYNRVSASGTSAETGTFSRKSTQARVAAKRDEPTEDRLSRLESIVRGENPLDRNRALLAYIDQMGPGDFEEAVAYFRNLGITGDRVGEYSLLLTAWAQADPTGALAYAGENIRNGFARDSILTTWASTDPDAAVRWANANFEGEGANPFMPGIIRGLAATDPAKATDLLTSMPKSVERGEGLDFILPHLLQQGTVATQAWVSAITDESLRNGAMLRVAEDLAKNDPAGTAAWLMANPGEASQRRMGDVYSVWASQDSQAAVSSFTSLPAGNDRTNALRGVISSFAVADPKAAVNLMDQYPGDVNDRIVQNFVWHSFRGDPATAATQIGRIGDESERDNMYRRALDAWIERDQDSAQAWIHTNPLPESVKDHLLNRQTDAPGGRQ
jgi:hypothetical protein